MNDGGKGGGHCMAGFISKITTISGYFMDNIYFLSTFNMQKVKIIVVKIPKSSIRLLSIKYALWQCLMSSINNPQAMGSTKITFFIEQSLNLRFAKFFYFLDILASDAFHGQKSLVNFFKMKHGDVLIKLS